MANDGMATMHKVSPVASYGNLQGQGGSLTGRNWWLQKCLASVQGLCHTTVPPPSPH